MALIWGRGFSDMNLNQEKTLASVKIDAAISATELDALLRKLALLRSEMSPPIPATREEIIDAGTVLIEDKPGLVIAARQEGGFRLWLRHRGYGWLAYQIDEPSATGLADFVRSRAKRPRVNLVEHEEPNRH